MIQLVPLLPNISSSASLHWFLRQVPYYCPPELSTGLLLSCLQLLLKLTKLKEKHNDTTTQTLMTQLVNY